MNYTIAAVIPVYNSWESAINAIESVLNQTLQCNEIIIIDDGSHDNSAENIKNYFSYLKQDVIKIYSIANLGAAGARNYGIDKAQSEWIAFLDSDDEWLPEKLNYQFSLIKKYSDIALVGALTNMVNFKRTNTLENHSVISLKNLLFKNYFQTSTVIIKRNYIIAVGGFPSKRKYAEEGDLFLKIAAKYKCLLLEKIMVNYANGKNGFGVSGLSANLLEMEKGELKNIFNVYLRNEASIAIIILAIIFSLLKFIRRILIVKCLYIFK